MPLFRNKQIKHLLICDLFETHEGLRVSKIEQKRNKKIMNNLHTYIFKMAIFRKILFFSLREKI